MDHFSVTSVHPATIKHALKGHPWITKDHLSSQWPKNTLLLHVKLAPQKIYTYLHDPQHTFCVARLIHTEKITTLEEWQKLIEQRMENAIKKRQELTALKNRNHYWLIFAEADLLPGLYIVYLNGHILIQTHMAYWNERIKDVISTLEYVFQRLAFTYSSFWWQTRKIGRAHV